MKLTILSAALTLACLSYAQQAPNHHDAMNQRGDQVMGFSEEKTTHHFRLYSDGGSIEVPAAAARNPESRDRIPPPRAPTPGVWAAGDFEPPMRAPGP